MSTPHVVNALRAKRAELSGEVIAARKRLETLRDDLDAIDRALRVFDPSQSPKAIRPVLKRKGAKLFAYGECTRAVLNALREASGPLTAAQIVERVALDCRVGTETPAVAAKLLAQVTAALGKAQRRGLVAGEGKPVRWALRP